MLLFTKPIITENGGCFGYGFLLSKGVTTITPGVTRVSMAAGHFLHIPGKYKIRLSLASDVRNAFDDQYVELRKASQSLDAILSKFVTYSIL